jgi:hypothetical protein
MRRHRAHREFLKNLCVLCVSSALSAFLLYHPQEKPP